MHHLSEHLPSSGPPTGIDVVSEVMPTAALTDVNKTCVGMQLFDEEQCRDSEIPRLSTEIGRCITCNSCQVRLEKQAFEDELTGLGNRYALMTHFNRMMKQDAPVLLLFTDLKNFKMVNDNVSHKVGDQMLTASANKLREMVRDEDGAAECRVGGDEIVVIMQLSHRIGNGEAEQKQRPVLPKEVPEIVHDIVNRVATGYGEIEEFRAYNELMQLPPNEQLGVRIGMAVAYPYILRTTGITLELNEFMDTADPKTHRFEWND